MSVKNPTIWFVGDSTTWSLKSFAGQLSRNHNFNVAIFADDSNFPVQSLFRANPDPERWKQDQVFMQKVFEYIKRHAKSKDIILVTGDFNHEFCTEDDISKCKNPYPFNEPIAWLNNNGRFLSRQEMFDVFVGELKELNQEVQKKEIKVVVSAPLPRWTGLHRNFCDVQWFKTKTYLDQCYSPTRQQQKEMRKPMLDRLNQLAASTTIIVFDPFDIFCDSDYCFYANVSTNENYFIDNTHLSTLGGIKLIESFLRTLNLK